MARTRTNVHQSLASGTRYRKLAGSVIVNQTQSVVYDDYKGVCTDSLGRTLPHALDIEKTSITNVPLNGEDGSGSNYRYYRNYVTVTQYSDTVHQDVNLPSEGSAMATALSRTNPGRAYVSVPTFVGELKDLPHLVRQVGSIAIRIRNATTRRQRRLPTASEAGGWYLGYTFGVAPLIGDVRRLLAFQAQVDRRVHELERLYSKEGLRRRVDLGGQTVHSSGNLTIDSSLGTLVTTRWDWVTTARRWATVRWKPTTLPSFNSDRTQRDLARRLVFGLTPQNLTQTAWNLIPWTWLADWFLNVDDWLGANQNSVPCQPAWQCVMTNIKTTRTYIRSNPNWVQGGDATLRRETKRRYVGGATLNTSLPFLNGRQLSILSALAINRYR